MRDRQIQELQEVNDREIAVKDLEIAVKDQEIAEKNQQLQRDMEVGRKSLHMHTIMYSLHYVM